MKTNRRPFFRSLGAALLGGALVPLAKATPNAIKFVLPYRLWVQRSTGKYGTPAELVLAAIPKGMRLFEVGDRRVFESSDSAGGLLAQYEVISYRDFGKLTDPYSGVLHIDQVWTLQPDLTWSKKDAPTV